MLYVPSVLVVVEVVVLVAVTVVVVVAVPQGQSRGTSMPVAFLRHTRASVAVIGNAPFGAQMQSKSHARVPTEELRMYKQSLAVGVGPVLTGCEQRPVTVSTLTTTLSIAHDSSVPPCQFCAALPLVAPRLQVMVAVSAV